MNKLAFAQALQDGVEMASQSAGHDLSGKPGRDVIVRMYGAGASGREVSAQEFIDRTWINDDTFGCQIYIAGPIRTPGLLEYPLPRVTRAASTAQSIRRYLF